MPGYVVVPQAIVDILAPAISSDLNQGSVIAETILRSDAGGIVQKMVAGEELTPLEKAQLPQLLRGHSWGDVAGAIQAEMKEHTDW